MQEELKTGFEPPKLQLNGKPILPYSDFFEKFEVVQFPHLNTLSQHMELLFAGDKNLSRQSFDSLPDLLRSYICFETWRSKGSVHGIHLDFGRHSYL